VEGQGGGEEEEREVVVEKGLWGGHRHHQG
jgi:hypothetical protein